MITFTKLGKKGMHLGNQLHQIASLIGFSEKYNCELVLPEWKYAEYFEHSPAQANIETNFLVEEKDFHYVPEYWDNYADIFQNENTDILGFLQSEKYWLHCKEKVHNTFRFKKEFTETIKLKFASVLTKKTIGISVRRGDFVTDSNHFLLPINYYLKALIKFFPNYKDFNIVIFSDDIEYCLSQIKHLPNIYFSNGLTAMEQLCFMSLCDHFIISNSTFSWWGAMLGEKKNSTIVRPAYHFDGELAKKNNCKDHYPERWIMYDHLSEDKDVDISKLLHPAFISSLLSKKRSIRKYVGKNKTKIKFKLAQVFKTTL